jgi:hypothetical protein
MKEKFKRENFWIKKNHENFLSKQKGLSKKQDEIGLRIHLNGLGI